MDNSNILGIDYGRVYLGLAISKEGECWPLKVIKSRSDVHKLEEIKKLVNEESIGRIIIGAGSGKIRNHLRGFVKKLQEKTKIEVITVDESLTSKLALKKMIQDGLSRKKRKEMEHAYAAYLILCIYLEEENGQKNSKNNSGY